VTELKFRLKTPSPPIHDREGLATGAVIVFRDVSAARAMALQLAHSAEHDFLTGFAQSNAPERPRESGHHPGAAPLEKGRGAFHGFGRLQTYNDSAGTSDRRQTSSICRKRLVNCVRGADTVSRQGGDEFVVLLSEVKQSEDPAITAIRLLHAVAEAHSIDQHDLHITTSIGVSVYPDDGLDAETLIKNADTAMYQAKENGRQSYQFFKAAMNVRAVKRQSIEESLRRAWNAGNLLCTTSRKSI